MNHGIQRAWSLLTEKSFSDSDSVIRGFASTPTPDRGMDIVEPDGIVFRTRDIKLHLYHDTRRPVGQVSFDAPVKKGIPFEARMPDVEEEGIVRDRVNEARHSVKYNLLSAVSIGFLPMEGGVEILKSGGYRFTKWEIVELSLTSVPMNPETAFHAVKSLSYGAPMPRDVVNLIRRHDAAMAKGAVPLIHAPKSSRVLPNGAVRLIR